MIRRNFLRQSGLVAGGLLLHNQLLQAFSVKADEPLRLGLIGCGDRGKGLLHVARELSDKYKIAAVCDVLDFRIDETKKMFPEADFKIHKDYRALLDDKSIQAVIVAVPLNLHYEIGLAALAAGKHVYLEKTMTYNIDQAESLVKKAASYKHQVLQIGHQYRYTPLYFKVKEMIEKGYLGKVTQIECRWDRNWNWRRPVPDPSLEKKINWRMYKAYSGGLPAELLSHQIDFINWAFNTHPDEVFGTGGIDNYKDGRETYDNVQVMFRYKQAGMIGNFGATCSNAHDGYLFRLKGTKGTVQLLVNDGVYYPEATTKKELTTVDGVAGATKIQWNKDGGIPIMTEPLKDGSWYALQDFHKCIAQKQAPTSNVITGATTAVCVHLSNLAIYNGVKQEWKKEYNFSQA